MDAERGTSSGAEKQAKAVVVVLIGAPGSGKSTFCEQVISSSSREWVRVCQDTIGKGKPGTKMQCVKVAADALNNGKSVFVDRCNLVRGQREEFVNLGDATSEIHALVLDLPAKLCISRSVERTRHEGNLQGGRAAAVVNRMLKNKELPELTEGFSRITVCRNEADVAAASRAYASLRPQDALPSGFFGRRSSSGVQLGIAGFFKKAEGAPPPELASPTSPKPETGIVSVPSNPWANALLNIAARPERHADVVLEFTDEVAVVTDRYPKSRKHVLVIARRDGLDSLSDVRSDHLPLLRTMHSVGSRWATEFIRENPSLSFRLGYHAVPSMRQLHLHVISQDFDSTFMRKKEHWNSFNTSFFRDSADVIAQVEEHHHTLLEEDDRVLSTELRCHRCRSAHPNLSRLKAHIAHCRAPLNADRLLCASC